MQERRRVLGRGLVGLAIVLLAGLVGVLVSKRVEAEQTVLVYGSIVGPDCGGEVDVLEVEGDFPLASDLDGLLDCRYDRIDFSVPTTDREIETYWKVVEQEVGPLGSCDDAVDCSTKISDLCARKGGASKVWFDRSSSRPCEGRCGNGDVVSVVCRKVARPRKPIVTSE